MSERPYCRVYHEVMEDEKFDGIREDMRLFGSWTMLLLLADMAHPSPAYIPPTVTRASVARLVAVGLVDEMPGHRYRIHGLAVEREKRTSDARASASARWSGRNATAMRPHSERIASKAEHSQDEQSIARDDGLPHLDKTVMGIWEQATGRTLLASGNYAAEYLDDACRRHPLSEVGAAVLRARKSFDHIPDAAQLVSAMRTILDPLPDRKQVAAVEDTAKRTAAGKRQLQLTQHSGGYHIDSPSPDCPKCPKGDAA